MDFAHVALFSAGWLAYASIHMIRKPMSLVSLKCDYNSLWVNCIFPDQSWLGFRQWVFYLSTWVDRLRVSPHFCSWPGKKLFPTLDWLFNAMVSQIFLGYLGDRKNGGQLLCFSLLASSIPLALLFPTFNNFGFLFILLNLLGVCQAPCWSLISRVFSQNFSSENRNTILGVLTSAAHIGGIIGTLTTVYVQYSYGWTYVYLIPGIISVCFICKWHIFSSTVSLYRLVLVWWLCSSLRSIPMRNLLLF